jgi:predicted AlkP superfamily phosphohydrolase/phosphomutase
LNLFKRIFKSLFKLPAPRRKILVLGLDGLEKALLPKITPHMPTLARILSDSALVPLQVPEPAENLVSWASFATGCNPGRHGVFGLVDRIPNPFSIFISNASLLQSPSLWETISRQGKSVGVMNVPLTYPPVEVNGIMVGCSLTPELDLARACYPVEIAPNLLEMGYRIEADNQLALTDPEAFVLDLTATMQNHFWAARQLMRTEAWDYWQLNELMIDRLQRFFYFGQAELPPVLEMAFGKLDLCLNELIDSLPADCQLVIVSAHGFNPCRASLMLNYWLEQHGYLLFSKNYRHIDNIHYHSRAYSLAPGRIYINLEGRESMGSVAPGQAYEDIRAELINRLQSLTLPASQEPAFKAIYRAEEIYSGPMLAQGPDIVALPALGIDLRANMNAPGLWQEPVQAGLPAAGQGLVCWQGMKAVRTEAAHITDLSPTLLTFLEIVPDRQMEGQSRL